MHLCSLKELDHCRGNISLLLLFVTVPAEKLGPVLGLVVRNDVAVMHHKSNDTYELIQHEVNSPPPVTNPQQLFHSLLPLYGLLWHLFRPLDWI